jgi:hypothetical protein
VLVRSEIDNMAFAFGLSETTRTHVERFGRAEIGDDDAQQIQLTKSLTWKLTSLAMFTPLLAFRYLGLQVSAALWLGLAMPIATGLAVSLVGAWAAGTLEAKRDPALSVWACRARAGVAAGIMWTSVAVGPFLLIIGFVLS